MHTTLNIQITEEDIQNGERANVMSCAANLAVRRAMKNRGWDFKNILVYDQVWAEGGGALCPVSEEMKKFVHEFDNGEAKPTEFLLFFE